MKASLQFPGDLTATIKCCIRSNFRYKIKLEVIGDSGKMIVMNPFVPQIFHWLTVKAGGKRHTERVKGESTYYYQLKAFYDAVKSNTPMITDIEEGIKNMAVIDAIYEKAGLPIR
jgi:predicted dehydrogenase